MTLTHKLIVNEIIILQLLRCFYFAGIVGVIVLLL